MIFNILLLFQKVDLIS